MSLVDDWKQTVIDFRAKAGQFLRDTEELKNKEGLVSKYPALHDDYNDLLDRSDIIYNTVKTLTGAVDKVAEWLGLDLTPGSTPKMGFLPLVPIAVIGASLAAIGKWTSDVYIFNRRLEEVKRLEAKGLSPERAAAIAVKAPEGMLPSLGRNVLAPLVPILLLGIGFWAYSKSNK